MFTQIKTLLDRAENGIVSDVLGAVALMALLLGSLHFPGTF